MVGRDGQLCRFRRIFDWNLDFAKLREKAIQATQWIFKEDRKIVNCDIVKSAEPYQDRCLRSRDGRIFVFKRPVLTYLQQSSKGKPFCFTCGAIVKNGPEYFLEKYLKRTWCRTLEFEFHEVPRNSTNLGLPRIKEEISIKLLRKRTSI